MKRKEKESTVAIWIISLAFVTMISSLFHKDMTAIYVGLIMLAIGGHKIRL